MPYYPLMQILQLVIALVIICSVVKLIRRWMDLKAERERAGGAARHELLERLDGLEERIRVLERIATDERADLRRQFRELGS